MTRSPDSLIPFGAGQPASEKRDDKSLQQSAGGRGESAGRNRSERHFSIVNPTSDHADSTGFIPGASLFPRGEACYGSEYSEKESELPGRCRGRRHAETDHPVNRRDPVRSGGGNSDRKGGV